MIQVCKFNPKTDIAEVDPFGFVDLHAALESGRLPASVPASEQSFDFVGDVPCSPSSIGGVPSDVFDALEMRDALRRAARHADDAAAAVAAAAAKQPAATVGES